MGWRDFQAAPPREFMESMESMNIETPLIPLIPLIPIEAGPEIGVEMPVSEILPEREILTSIKPFWASWEIMGEATAIIPDDKPNLFCADGDCWCSQKLPAADYPSGCGACEYLNNPRQAKEQAENMGAAIYETN